jgi:Uma2 family endonuclease
MIMVSSPRVEPVDLDIFRAFASLPENRGRLFELIDGEIVEKMGSFTPSYLAAWIATFINLYLMQNPIGYVTGADGAYILSDDHALMPDVGYISRARLPTKPDREVPGAPDLAVEVKSPNDSKRELRRKAELYMRFGTKIVWLVFPETRQIEVYLPDQDVRELGIDDTLDGGDVLPGFSLPVKQLFPQENA